MPSFMNGSSWREVIGTWWRGRSAKVGRVEDHVDAVLAADADDLLAVELIERRSAADVDVDVARPVAAAGQRRPASWPESARSL